MIMIIIIIMKIMHVWPGPQEGEAPPLALEDQTLALEDRYTYIIYIYIICTCIVYVYIYIYMYMYMCICICIHTYIYI